MCLRFVCLLITRVAAWLRLSRREDAWKIAEILILRHQLVVLQRQPAGVRAENPVHGSDQQSCSPMRPAVMITDHVPEVRLPPDHADDHVAAAVPARGDVEDRRDFAAAPPRHRPAAPSGAPPEPELGGPGPARDVVRRDTDSVPAQAAVAGHPWTRSRAGTATSPSAAGRPDPCAAGPAARRPARTSQPWPSGWPGMSQPLAGFLTPHTQMRRRTFWICATG